MADLTEPMRPVGRKDRIASIDVLRGFSLLGILLMNIVAFGLPMGAYFNPSVYGGDSGRDLAAWFIAQVFFDGKMRCIFSMLFGAGAVLLLERAERRGAGIEAADIYYRRTMWLIVFGLIHGHLIWGGDILYHYGVVGLLLFPLRRLSARALLITGSVILVLHSVQGLGGGIAIGELREKAIAAAAIPNPTAEERKTIREWEQVAEIFEPTPEAVEKEIAAHRGGWLDVLPLRSAEASLLEFTLFFQFLFLDVLCMLVLGMGLAKAGMFDASRSYRFYGLIALAGFAVGIPVNTWAAEQYRAAGFTTAAQFTYIGSTADLGRFSIALAYTSLIMIASKGGLRFLTRPLAAVGRTALSNYLLTSILCTLFFNGYGLGYFAKLSRHELYWVVLGMWVVNLTVSPLWLRYFQFGPAEWLWRSLTYWKRQPLAVSRSLTVAAR